MAKGILLLDVGNTCLTAAYVKEGYVERPTILLIEEGYFQDIKRMVSSGSTLVVASVNPRVSDEIEEKFIGLCSIFLFGRDFGADMPVLLEEPEELGADRLLNAVAAYRRFGASVVVDFGTATTFDIVSPNGEYLGGAITPGVRISLKALSAYTALLPDVKPLPSPPLVGRSTRQALSSGVIHGTAAMVDGMLARYEAELEFEFKAVATGGAGELVLPYCERTLENIPSLTLEGLYICFEESGL